MRMRTSLGWALLATLCSIAMSILVAFEIVLLELRMPEPELWALGVVPGLTFVGLVALLEFRAWWHDVRPSLRSVIGVGIAGLLSYSHVAFLISVSGHCGCAG